MKVYRRCLYCNSGTAGIEPWDMWHPSTGFLRGRHFFPEEYEDMMGHKIRVTAKSLFPFVEYILTSDVVGERVIPLDSLDVRMLNTIARILNFT
ncbi:hypothetical protein SK128_017371 [Halocaridina rubra]